MVSSLVSQAFSRISTNLTSCGAYATSEGEVANEKGVAPKVPSESIWSSLPASLMCCLPALFSQSEPKTVKFDGKDPLLLSVHQNLKYLPNPLGLKLLTLEK